MTELVGKPIGPTGYGLMGFTWRSPPIAEDQAFEAMKAALNNGSTFWNGGEFYGPPEYNSLHLLNSYFTKYPQDADKIVISIKGAANPQTRAPEGFPEGVRRSVDQCLKVLDGKKKLDLFECARVDQNTPIEVAIRTLAEYVKEGKLGGISLSECSADSIRRAAKVHKISAVEVEFSLFYTEILENGVAKACGELGIPIVAYSPLGRGFLTGQFSSIEDIDESDPRRHSPQFTGANFEKNMELKKDVEEIAKRKGCTIGQVALAWVKSYSKKPGMPTFIPIPGATKAERVQENTKEITLTNEEIAELDEFVKKVEVQGDRYPSFVMKYNYGDSPPEE